jgi:large subunit ribosomal protein LP0
MQLIRKTLRGNSVILMGKNTMIRKAIRGHLAKNPRLEDILNYVKGNVGFIFTKGDLADVKSKVMALKVDAPARVGAVAPADVVVPPGPTGLEPTQTSFLQALNIPSKINKGQVEIMNEVVLVRKGERIGQSEAALLQKLNIKPFKYGLNVTAVYEDGSVYEPSVLDLTEADIIARFTAAARNVTALGLSLSFPTSSAVPHLLIDGYKNVLAVGLAADFSFPRLAKLKSAVAAAAAPPAPAASAPAQQKGEKEEKKEKKEEKKEEEKQEEPAEEEGFYLDLFG